MEELKELVKVSLSGRISGVETFNQFTESKKSLTFKLFSNISRRKILTDDDAKEILYGKQYSGKSYDVLKKRFKEKLYTNLLFVQPRQKDTKSYAYNAYFIHKHYIVAKLLLMIAARKAGKTIMEKVFKRAQLYEVTEIAMLASLYLKKESAVLGDSNSYSKYSAEFYHLADVLKAENQAEEQYENLFMNFIKVHNPRPDLIPKAKESVAHIKKLKKVYNTFVLHLTEFQVQTLYYDLCNDYKATLRVCNAFEKYLISRPAFYSTVRHGNIYTKKLTSYLHLGQYKEGLQLAVKGLRLHESLEGNRILMQEIYFLLAIRSGEYKLAADIFQSVSNPVIQKNKDERYKEIWRIYSGYLWFCLTAFQMIEIRDETFQKTKEFKLAKLLNTVQIYSKDKQGLNLSLSILQLVILIQRNEFVKTIEKIEHLKKYIHKHINGKSGARDHILLKLILLLQKYDFNPVIAERKSVELLNRLTALTSRENTYDRTHIEVLPYSMLWEMLLNGLKNSITIK